jgi:hypothetical protein
MADAPTLRREIAAWRADFEARHPDLANEDTPTLRRKVAAWRADFEARHPDLANNGDGPR